MQIIALGSDVIECVRIRELIERYGESFLRRAFSDREIRHCQSRRQSTEHFAGTWAAKEAVMKCLAAPARVHRIDAEIRADSAGAVQVVLHGTARERADDMKINSWLITVSHCREFATATAIALGPIARS